MGALLYFTRSIAPIPFPPPAPMPHSNIGGEPTTGEHCGEISSLETNCKLILVTVE